MAHKALVRRGRYVDREPTRPHAPYRRLMIAVLEAALEDVGDAADGSSAAAWVVSTDRRWPYSFENLCEALDIDPHDVRRALQRRMAPLA